MNLKYYIRGLGAGLIIAAAALMISDAVGTESDLGVNENQQQTTIATSIIAYTTEAETTVQETTSQKATIQETTIQETTAATQQTTADNKEATTADNVDNTVKISIHNVNYATQASDILLQAGVIEDANDFTEYLVNNGYSSKIREGEYDIQRGASYDVIAKIITQE